MRMRPGANRIEPTKLRVVLAEASPAVRERYRKALERLPTIEIVGEAGRDDEALELSFRLQPEMVVVSASLPDRGGFEVLRRLKRAMTYCEVVLMSHRPCTFIRTAGSLLGAHGVCPIEDGLAELCDLVRSALKNQRR